MRLLFGESSNFRNESTVFDCASIFVSYLFPVFFGCFIEFIHGDAAMSAGAIPDAALRVVP